MDFNAGDCFWRLDLSGFTLKMLCIKEEPTLALPIEQVKNLPRKAKRKIWISWWKYKRNEIPGDTRLEQRNNWRNLWNELRTVN